MHIKKYTTSYPKKEKLDQEQRWWIVDGTGQVVGRLAGLLANYARGKHKPGYAPHIDGGDQIIVINGGKVRLTGKKLKQKKYVRYTGYPGGQRFATPLDWMQKQPERVLLHALKGMMPKNRLGKKQLKHVHIYAGDTHPHQAQKPVQLPLSFISSKTK